MSGEPFTFATSCAEPDRVFGSLAALARYVLVLRGGAPLVGGAPPELVARDGTLARSDLPGGRMVSIRILDGAHAGRGSLLGYVLMPLIATETGAIRVMEAIVAAEAPLEGAAA